MTGKCLLPFAVLLIAASSAFAREPRTWISAFNQAEESLDVVVMERAEDVARKRWLSVSGEVMSTAGVNSAQSLVPIQLELVWMNLRIASVYLKRWNDSPTTENIEAFDISVRRLYFVSKNLEPLPYAVRLLVGISRFDGQSWDIGYDLGIDPKPGLRFDLYFGYADGAKIADFRPLYHEQVKSREGSILTGVLCTASLFLLCPSSFLTKDERELSSLGGSAIYLDVHDADGARIDLGRVRQVVEPELNRIHAQAQGIDP